MVLCSSHQKCTHPESQRGKTPTRPRLSSDHKLPPGTSVRSRRRERWRNSVCLEEPAGATAQGSEGAWGLGEEGPGWAAWRLRGPRPGRATAARAPTPDATLRLREAVGLGRARQETGRLAMSPLQLFSKS